MNNSLIIETEEKVTEYALKETCLKMYPEGTVLVAMYGGFNQIGRTGILKTPASVNQALVAIQIDNKRFNSCYLLNFLNFNVGYWRSVASSSRKDPNITSYDVKKFKLIGPSEKTEQTAIAKALSDTDALIQSLNQLITKKRQIKQGAMQQLLNPYDKFGELNDGWEVCQIKDYCLITTGNKNTQDRVENGDFPFFVRSQTIERINTYSFDGEAVLTAGDGVGTGKVFHYINGKFDFHQRVYKMSCFSEKLDGYYFFLYFSKHFYNRISQMTAKSSVDSIRMEMIAEMLIPIPPKTEQTQIAKTLTNIDTEITKLENKRTKYQKIKQGMMQNLLTGRIRLV